MDGEYLPYGHQWIDGDDVEAVAQVLRSATLTGGPEVAAFEADLAGATGAPCVAVLNSGTSALHAAYAALGVGGGDEIITSPLTFAATGNAALYLGARPVFVDVDRATGLIDPGSIESAVTDRTRAIVAVDYAGQPADYDAIATVAARHGLPVVADAAHSLGATDRGRAVGTLADVTVLSFHPVKAITTGEGGAVLTNDGSILRRILEFRSHGVVRDVDRLEREEGPWYSEMQGLGFNYRLTDIQSALGRSQLAKLPAFLVRRRAIAGKYDRSLAEIAGISLPQRRPGVQPAWHLYVIHVVDPSRRRRFFEALRARGLGVQVHYLPMYRHPYYRALGYRDGICPEAERFYAGAVSLPLYPALQDADVDRVIRTVRTVASEVLV